MSFNLVLISSEPEKSFFLHLGENKIGRDATVNHIQLISNEVSRCHASIDVTEDSCSIRDTQSTNGIDVNGKNVSKSKLKDGDIITVGDINMRLECTNAPYASNAEFSPNKFSDKTRFATMKHKPVHPSRLKSFFQRNKK